MTTTHYVHTGDLIDEITLSLEELANSCQVDKTWVLERIESGSLTCIKTNSNDWYFSSQDLIRAKRLLSIERGFDANEELAALVADLLEEVHTLKKEIKLLKSLENI